MPKVNLILVQPTLDGPATLGSTRNYFQKSTITFFTENINFVQPYFDSRSQQFMPQFSAVGLTGMVGPVIVEAPQSQIIALMENKPYFPIPDGSGGSTSGGSVFDASGGTGGSTSTLYPSTVNTTFNGACITTVTETYYHNGSGTLPAAGNKVFSDSSMNVILPDGYYGIDPTAEASTVATKLIKVVNGFVEPGYPLSCGEQQISEIP